MSKQNQNSKSIVQTALFVMLCFVLIGSAVKADSLATSATGGGDAAKMKVTTTQHFGTPSQSEGTGTRQGNAWWNAEGVIDSYVLEVSNWNEASKKALRSDLNGNAPMAVLFREADELKKAEYAESWKRLGDLGRNQIKKDPDILRTMNKIMKNPHIPSNRLDDIINSLAESGARCRTCANTGTEGLRYIDDVLDDLDAFATEFKNSPGYDDFLREMGEQVTKATGGSWTIEALMRNRSKYFDGHTITGFEIKHVPNREFAADVITDVEGVTHYTEFKSWSSNLMGTSNMVDQITGTMQVINNLDEMKFIFNPSRWTPTASQLKTALQSKATLFDDLLASGKLQQLMPDEVILSTSDFIDNLANSKYFDKVFIVQ